MSGDVEEQEEDGAFVACKIAVQCMACGNASAAEFGNATDDEMDVVCPHCSNERGVRTVIPCAIFVGQDAVDVLELLERLQAAQPHQGAMPLEDGAFAGAPDDSQPFAGDALDVQEGNGPMQRVGPDDPRFDDPTHGLGEP